MRTVRLMYVLLALVTLLVIFGPELLRLIP